MESSLQVPTATSVRAVPAKLLIDNRVVINNHLARRRGGKVRFTHIIGYAIVKALASMPEMNNGFGESGRQAGAGRAGPRQPRPGHRHRQAGRLPRTCWCPSIKATESMDFAHFWTAYEDVVRKARANKLTVEDFAGTTISLTNPGTIGTVHSVPRLMAGQGTIIGVGALEYPAEWQGASEETLNRNAVSKILTITSTYDHRIIQGAQSGDFLRVIHQLLLGENGFYDEIFESLRIPYEPIRWIQDISTSHDDDVNKTARVQELIHAYRVRGHLMADIDPLEYRQRRHPDLDVTTHGLTLWDLEREFATGGFGGAPMLKLPQDPGHPARLVLPHRRHRVHAHPGPRPAPVAAVQARGALRQDLRGRAAADRAPAQRRRGVRDVPADQVRGSEAVQPRGRRVRHRAARPDPVPGRRRGPGRGVHRYAAPRSAQRAGQHRGQVLRADLPRVRGHARTPSPSRAPAT